MDDVGLDHLRTLAGQWQAAADRLRTKADAEEREENGSTLIAAVYQARARTLMDCAEAIRQLIPESV